tara:strand:- start:39 stop:302 length:264 start_codon:yes stop_codon:yes gene_type:complete
MSLNIHDLKNKIFYRSSYRGTKEMDILLKSFVKDIIDNLNANELNNLLDLLKIDDVNLYKYKQGLKTELKLPENKITKLFKNYNYKK